MKKTPEDSKSESPNAPRTAGRHSRRSFLAATTVGAMLPGIVSAQAPHELGAPMRPYGARSPFEKAVVREKTMADELSTTGSSLAPLQDLYGTITPSSLHYVRIHSGVPAINPAKHELMIHGLVERPLMFNLSDLMRLPAVSRIQFLECSGNSQHEYLQQDSTTPQRAAGLVSCSEWSGVLLSTLLNEVGVKPEAQWVLAEGADASRLARSVPLEKAMDDVIVAYAQNGEAVRPEQGFPLRLVVPGWEGNISVKWLHRLELLDQPAMTRDEAAYYTDLLPDGKARHFAFVMEAKSLVTRPAGGQRLPTPGLYEITGLAWSGRARVTAVEVSVDGGHTWNKTALQQPNQLHSLVRFRMPWNWDGREAVIGSRCIDESGYIQPERAQLLAVRGRAAAHHYNGIVWWRLRPSGELVHA
jgi:sulfane dehydrogenase subunit SoxC